LFFRISKLGEIDLSGCLVAGRAQAGSYDGESLSRHAGSSRQPEDALRRRD